jgi:hypothetical protein
MATNFYFNNFKNSQEQLLIENLIVESIKIYGHELFYLPRKRDAYDPVYGESPLSSFNNAYMIEMYIKNVEGFAGEGDFLSKFNLEIRDRVTFTMSRRSFNDEIGNLEGFIRPREGDLIFFPLNNKIFEIKFVEHEAIFYQLGALQTFDIQCELFEYSNEIFSTGVTDIDNLYDSYQLDVNAFTLKYERNANGYSFAILDEAGFDLVTEGANIGEKVADNSPDIQTEGLSFIDFTEIDPFSEGKI